VGLNVTPETFISSGLNDIKTLKVEVGETELESYILDSISSDQPGITGDFDGANYKLEIPKNDTGPILLPSSLIGGDFGYIFVKVTDSSENTATSLAKLNMNPNGLVSCESVEHQDDDTPNPKDIDTSGGLDLAVCYRNETCLNYMGEPSYNDGYGEVTTCMTPKKSWHMQINNYPGDVYKIGRVCVDTFGDMSCDTLLRESPSNCKDCCTDYGTGVPEADFFTCFSHCGVQN